MKTVLCFLLLVCVPGLPDAGAITVPKAAPTPEPARDALRQTIEPMVDVFARAPEGGNRAVTAQVRIAESTIQPPELVGRTLAFRVVAAPADKAFFQFASMGTIITMCRQGQTVWASPASRLAPLLAKVEAAKPTKADQAPLAPLRLKVPVTLFWALFRFAPIHDAGTRSSEGVDYRLADVDSDDDEDPEAKHKSLRLAIRLDRHQITSIEARDRADHTTYAIEEMRYVPTLPDSDFQPTTEQRADMLQVPVERFRPLMKLIGEEEKRRRKELREHRQ